MTYAQRRADIIERQRAKYQSVATLELLANGTEGRQYDTLVLLTRFFFVKRVSNLAIGAEYLEAQIAEQPGVDHAACLRIIAARFAGAVYKASVVEEFIDDGRMLLIRLTPGSEA